MAVLSTVTVILLLYCFLYGCCLQSFNAKVEALLADVREHSAVAIKNADSAFQAAKDAMMAMDGIVAAWHKILYEGNERKEGRGGGDLAREQEYKSPFA